MPEITSSESFRQSLSELPIAQQRMVGARFIANVLDLTTDARLENAQETAGRREVDAHELESAYHAAHSAYVENHPRSDLAELDWSKQAAHFVAEACMVCLAPTYSEAQKHHLAEKVAKYCLMARICSSVEHEGDYPNFDASDEAVKKETHAQRDILSSFLEEA